MSIVGTATTVSGIVGGIAGLFGSGQEKDYAAKQAAIDSWYNQALSEGSGGSAYAKLQCIVGNGPPIMQAAEWPVAASGRREIRCDGSSQLRTYAQAKIQALQIAWTAQNVVSGPINRGVTQGLTPVFIAVLVVAVIVGVMAARKGR